MNNDSQNSQLRNSFFTIDADDAKKYKCNYLETL